MGTHPAVGLAAVIGRADAKWGERPGLIVEWQQGLSMHADTLLGFLRGKLAGWCLPEEILQVEAMPLATTGKINKNRLRADYANGKLTPD